jgi:hypothetical protein
MWVALEQTAVKGAQRVDGDVVDSGRGELTLGDQMVEPALNLRGFQLIGRAVMEPGQVGNSARLCIRVAAVADPFGNPFGVIESLHFSVENVQ